MPQYAMQNCTISSFFASCADIAMFIDLPSNQDNKIQTPFSKPPL